MIAKFLFSILATFALCANFALAKEPTNWMFGVGGGYGMTSLDMKHSHFLRHPVYKYFAGVNGGNATYDKNPDGTPKYRFSPLSNTALNSWSGSWEILLGYKHFVNDWLGVRAYGNIGVQHYKPSLFESKTDPIGIIDYTINADLLFDFYETESWAIGMLAGLGFGGSSFDKDAIAKYMAVYDRETGMPIGVADIQKHFLNINASVGLRGVYFQKIRKTSQRVCGEYVEGKRTCRVPVAYIGHNFEINAKYNILRYEATENPDILEIATDKFVSRPQYIVKNPWRITFRYIIDF